MSPKNLELIKTKEKKRLIENPYLSPLERVLKDVLGQYEEEDLSYGMRIDNLWRKVQTEDLDVDFEQFEDCLLWLIHQYIEEVSPSEGISNENQKIIYDRKVTQKYFHYIKIRGITTKI